MSLTRITAMSGLAATVFAVGALYLAGSFEPPDTTASNIEASLPTIQRVAEVTVPTTPEPAMRVEVPCTVQVAALGNFIPSDCPEEFAYLPNLGEESVEVARGERDGNRNRDGDGDGPGWQPGNNDGPGWTPGGDRDYGGGGKDKDKGDRDYGGGGKDKDKGGGGGCKYCPPPPPPPPPPPDKPQCKNEECGGGGGSTEPAPEGPPCNCTTETDRMLRWLNNPANASNPTHSMWLDRYNAAQMKFGKGMCSLVSEWLLAEKREVSRWTQNQCTSPSLFHHKPYTPITLPSGGVLLRGIRG